MLCLSLIYLLIHFIRYCILTFEWPEIIRKTIYIHIFITIRKSPNIARLHPLRWSYASKCFYLPRVLFLRKVCFQSTKSTQVTFLATVTNAEHSALLGNHIEILSWMSTYTIQLRKLFKTAVFMKGNDSFHLYSYVKTCSLFYHEFGSTKLFIASDIYKQ